MATATPAIAQAQPQKQQRRVKKIYQVTVKQFSGKRKQAQLHAFSMEEATYVATLGQKKLLEYYSWWGGNKSLKQSEVALNVTVKCLGKVARNPAREAAIIAAEKKAKALARQMRNAQNKAYADQQKKEADELAKNRRKRVHNQFAFALAQVKALSQAAGASPNTASAVTASQHVTCSRCEKPAFYLILTRASDAAATKLDIENNVVDALCNGQQCSYYAIQHQKLPYVRCDRLEFFFPDLMKTPVVTIKKQA